ncbi:DNA topoisomerase IB [Reyranella sp.]|uniref:DNA topoisomerase IB n=1 Tax=Reyranella sp. TaxID=1929291 RepID=UPI0025CDA1FA|nr:DNA topoisomerase IB [Reyranella sp.]
MLVLRRQRCGKGFRFVDAQGATITDAPTVSRLRSLAMPPAYVNVRYAANPTAHLQAVGEDAAGRLQYRYHPNWHRVREIIKARKLHNIARTLPAISRKVRRFLRAESADSRRAAAAVVYLVSKTALRAGSDSYARERGTRGATTLLKSNVEIDGLTVRLHFRGKGARMVTREVRDRTLAATCRNLLVLPGRRLFQYRDADGALHVVRAADVNAFLREVSGVRVSLKDFRTLVASAGVMKALAAAPPARTLRARKALLRDAIAAAAQELANTPTVCRKSYVHEAVIAAFEQGELPPAAGRTLEGTAQALARVVARHR